MPICGENCAIQICPRCAPSEDQERVVDLILGLTLGDIDESSDSLDEILITLPKCGHIFTVETLDGICEMNDYYIQKDGTWLDLKAPVNETVDGERKKPPVCPTCRAAITSPRYGRVYKAADLDILERNVISRMSTQLETVSKKMDTISKVNLEAMLVTSASNIQPEVTSAGVKVRKALVKAQKASLSEKVEIPLLTVMLDPDNKDLFLISSNVATAWMRTIKPLVQIYDHVIKVAETRPPHIKAWEASWSYLVEEEMKLAAADPTRAPRNLHQYAMQMARMKVGQPQPRADKRFLVEAIWATIQIRFILSDLAVSWLSSAGKNGHYRAQQLQMWAQYVSFLLQGCLRDTNLSYKIAKESKTRRQMTTSQLLLMRVELEQYRLEYKLAQESRTIQDQRMNLADRALAGARKVSQGIQHVVQEHRSILPGDEKDWLPKNFTETAQSIQGEWEKLEKSIRMDTFYETVSLDEKMCIVKALKFLRWCDARGKVPRM
ncbi:hypothetical protein H0H93_005816 [Arthromyces matolae]|nr:hypothetical protein H0H93_005816 [Arthromyces matolae]